MFATLQLNGNGGGGVKVEAVTDTAADSSDEVCAADDNVDNDRVVE